MSDIQNGPFIVTGASGQLGRQVVDLLLQAGAGPIIAVSRNTEKLADLADKGVETRQGDFNDPASLGAAFTDAGIGVCVAARLGHEENGSGRFPQIGAGQAGCLCQLIQPAVDPAGMHLHPFEFMVSRQRR
ncbi:NAD(P)H-binding protein (plasmid) [Roseibium aggregatum]|nr:NAD(P)H-binding protein [Roseibium aggregatum]